MILARREQLASGLRRPLSATWPEPVSHEHEGRLRLWIGFQRHLQGEADNVAAAEVRARRHFEPFPFGTDPRGRRVDSSLFENNWLVGAAPGQGKTRAVRVLACCSRADPLTELWVHELAGKGDLEPLAQICSPVQSGLDDEAVGYAAASLQMLRGRTGRRSQGSRSCPRKLARTGRSPATWPLAGRCGCSRWSASSMSVRTCSCTDRHGDRRKTTPPT